MIKYFRDGEILRRAIRVIEERGLDHIDPGRIICFRSRGTKSRRVIARCWSLPIIWQNALEKEPHYVIEMISERFDKLDEEEKDRVMLHELLHIPKGFRGGLRHHQQLRKELERLG